MVARLAIKNLIYLFFLGFSLQLPAADQAREQRWAEQIEDSIVVGEPVWLEVQGEKLLGIYTEESTGEPRGSVILIHGMGVHPNWDQVIYPLRTRLPEYGWTTLSIQMPVLARDARFADYAPLISEAIPRIQAAGRYLTERNAEPIFIVAHSLGTLMAEACLAATPDLPARGLVAIGMTASDIDPLLNSLGYIEKISLPVFDLYGSRDLPAVLETAAARKKAARKAGNTHYRQLEIEGADHFFTGLDDELVRRVRGWLEQEIRTR